MDTHMVIPVQTLFLYYMSDRIIKQSDTTQSGCLTALTEVWELFI